jgi:hypothetical protein
LLQSGVHPNVTHPASWLPEDWLRFVHIPPFPGQWDRLGLGRDDLSALEMLILGAPQGGAVIQGTRGVRKARFAVPGSGKGKSGSYRVFYVYFPEYGTVCLLAIIAKGEREDLDKATRNELGKLVERLGRILENGAGTT